MRALVLLSSLSLTWLATPAFADIPPPEGYVEQCTVEKQCKKTDEGTTCSTYHGDNDKCKKLHASDGYEFKCKTRGATTWTEVYCRPKAPPKKSK